MVDAHFSRLLPQMAQFTVQTSQLRFTDSSLLVTGSVNILSCFPSSTIIYLGLYLEQQGLRLQEATKIFAGIGVLSRGRPSATQLRQGMV